MFISELGKVVLAVSVQGREEALETGNRAFYEFAEVKPPQSIFSFRVLFLLSRRTFHVSILPPGSPARRLGEAGNTEVIVPRIPRYLGVLIRPPGLFSGFRAFGLVASSGVRPHRVGMTFYPS